MRFSVIKKKLPLCHIESARNVPKCINYCKKEKTRVKGQGPWEFGTFKKNGGDRKSAKFHYEDLKLNIIGNNEYMEKLNPSIHTYMALDKA